MNELIKQFEEWNDFIATIRDRNWGTSLGEGKWRIHDVVSHIMLWDKYFFEAAIGRIAKGQELTLRHLDYDTFNQGAVEQGKQLLKEDLIQLTLQHRNAIISSIKAMAEEQIAKEYVDADGNPFRIETYLRDFIWHDSHHRSQIEQVLSEPIV